MMSSRPSLKAAYAKAYASIILCSTPAAAPAVVADAKYVVGFHASERLEERGIVEWQAVGGLEDGELIADDQAKSLTRL